jgi:hypothetical protein
VALTRNCNTSEFLPFTNKVQTALRITVNKFAKNQSVRWRLKRSASQRNKVWPYGELFGLTTFCFLSSQFCRLKDVWLFGHVLLDCEHFQLCHTGGIKSSCNVHGSNIFSQSHNPTENPVILFITNDVIPGSRNQRTDNVLTNGLMNLELSLSSALQTLIISPNYIYSLQNDNAGCIKLAKKWSDFITGSIRWRVAGFNCTWKQGQCIVVKIIGLPHKKLRRLQSSYCIR